MIVWDKLTITNNAGSCTLTPTSTNQLAVTAASITNAAITLATITNATITNASITTATIATANITNIHDCNVGNFVTLHVNDQLSGVDGNFIGDLNSQESITVQTATVPGGVYITHHQISVTDSTHTLTLGATGITAEHIVGNIDSKKNLYSDSVYMYMYDRNGSRYVKQPLSVWNKRMIVINKDLRYITFSSYLEHFGDDQQYCLPIGPASVILSDWDSLAVWISEFHTPASATSANLGVDRVTTEELYEPGQSDGTNYVIVPIMNDGNAVDARVSVSVILYNTRAINVQTWPSNYLDFNNLYY